MSNNGGVVNKKSSSRGKHATVVLMLVADTPGSASRGPTLAGAMNKCS
jgi:hypothetical protein